MENSMLKIFTDGGARGNPGPAAAAFVVYGKNVEIFRRGVYVGESTNNVAEYRALIEALKWVKENKNGLVRDFNEIKFCLDSLLVVNQLKGSYRIKNANLKTLIFSVRTLEKGIGITVDYCFIPRVQNKVADRLVNKTIDESNCVSTP
jgi:ribonuclease HI